MAGQCDLPQCTPGAGGGIIGKQSAGHLRRLTENAFYLGLKSVLTALQELAGQIDSFPFQHKAFLILLTKSLLNTYNAIEWFKFTIKNSVLNPCPKRYAEYYSDNFQYSF